MASRDWRRKCVVVGLFIGAFSNDSLPVSVCVCVFVCVCLSKKQLIYQCENVHTRTHTHTDIPTNTHTHTHIHTCQPEALFGTHLGKAHLNELGHDVLVHQLRHALRGTFGLRASFCSLLGGFEAFLPGQKFWSVSALVNLLFKVSVNVTF